MSRAVLLLSAAVLALAAVVLAKPQPGKLDSVNVDDVLKNKRLFNNYVKCIMDKGPCSAEASELKQSIPDALFSECSKCSEKQKTMAEKVLKYLLENEKDIWVEFKAKYDPAGTYEKKYKERAEQHGLKV